MASFGERFKTERERKGITLDEIAASTKIGTRMLRALEEEHFDQLPGGIFNKGFVRAYARALGLDEDQAVADYLTAAGSVPGKKPENGADFHLDELGAEAETNGASRIPWGILAVGLLILALGLTVWGFRSRELRRHDRPVTTLPQSRPVTTPSVSSPTPAQDAAASRAASASPAAGQHPVTDSVGEPASSSAAAPLSADPSRSSAPLPGTFLVLIKARENSWVSITADGSEIMQTTLLAPWDKSVRAQKEVVVKAGNIGALDFYFNGQKLPPQGDYKEVKTLTFDAQGLQPPPLATRPQGQLPPQP